MSEWDDEALAARDSYLIELGDDPDDYVLGAEAGWNKAMAWARKWVRDGIKSACKRLGGKSEVVQMRFEIAAHSVVPGKHVVMVYDTEGVFVGQVCIAEDDRSIKVISKYATGNVIEDDRLPNTAGDGRRIRSYIIELGD